MVHQLHVEKVELREEAAKLEKEVEDLNADRVHLKRKAHEKFKKYSRLKQEIRQQQKEHTAQLQQELNIHRVLKDQLETFE